MSEKETYQQLIDSLQTALKLRTQANELRKEILSVTETVIQRHQQQIANLELINKILEVNLKNQMSQNGFWVLAWFVSMFLLIIAVLLSFLK